MVAAPGKPPSSRRRAWMVQASPASIGAGGAVEVVAVEAEPGLEPQRVAGGQPGERHLRLGQQRLGQFGRPVGGDGDLEAVLAGVAGAADAAPGCRRSWPCRSA